MAFCAKCGAQVAAGATFCPACGAPQSASGSSTGVATGTGLDENVAGLLSYVVGWVTGLIFFVIDKRPFVRFHAAQSMVTFGAISAAFIALGVVVSMSFVMHLGFIGTLITMALDPIIGLVALAAWILSMVKAYNGERFKLPFVGDIAENIAGK